MTRSPRTLALAFLAMANLLILNLTAVTYMGFKQQDALVQEGLKQLMAQLPASQEMILALSLDMAGRTQHQLMLVMVLAMVGILLLTLLGFFLVRTMTGSGTPPASTRRMP